MVHQVQLAERGQALALVRRQCGPRRLNSTRVEKVIADLHGAALQRADGAVLLLTGCVGPLGADAPPRAERYSCA